MKFIVSLLVSTSLACWGWTGGRAPEREITFTEELRFGGLADDNLYNWVGSLFYVLADKEGRIILAEEAGSRVLLFSKDGEFIKQIAGPGEGPGEISRLGQMQFLENGQLAIHDRQRGNAVLEFFDQNYTWIKATSVRSPKYKTLEVALSPKGDLCFYTYNILNQERNEVVQNRSLADMSLEVKLKLGETVIPMPGNPTETNSAFVKRVMANAIKLGNADQSFAAFDSNGDIYIAFRRAAKITKYSPTLEPITTFSVNPKKHVRSQDEIQIYLTDLMEQAKAYYPDFKGHISLDLLNEVYAEINPDPAKPYILGLVATDNGLLAITDDDRPKNIQSGELFDRSGRPIGKLKVKDQALLGEDDNIRIYFRQGKAYSLLSDEENHYLVRYAYKASGK